MSRIILASKPHVSDVDVFINPGDSIQSFVNSYPENTRFGLRAGIYRMQSVTPKNGNTFDGEAGAVLNGSRLLTSFTQNGSVWVATGQTQEGFRSGFCLPGYPRCTYPEDLYIDDVPKLHVASLGAVGPGKWFFDYAADTVYIGDDPAGRKVEIGVTARAFGGTARNVTIRNLMVEKYAGPLQQGAVSAARGDNWIIENNTIQLNHGPGLSLGPNVKVLRNRILSNGHSGYGGGPCANFLVEGNEIAWNNYAGVDWAWEAGGGKVAVTPEGGIIRGNCVHDNNGSGIWVDIDANNVIIEDNLVFRNSITGIHYEISYDGIIRNNIVVDNGQTGYQQLDWFWAPQILISSASRGLVYGNTVDVPSEFGNAITIVSQNRPPYTPAIDNEIYNNTVTIRGLNGGRLGAVTDVAGDVSTVANSNSMHDNTYHLASISRNYWTWGGSNLNWAGILAAGQEGGSTADTNLPPKPILDCGFLG